MRCFRFRGGAAADDTAGASDAVLVAPTSLTPSPARVRLGK